MPRGFLVKREYTPVYRHDHLRYREEDQEIQHFGMFHSSLQHYENSLTNSLYSNHQNPLHSLVERLGFDPHPLYLYSEPLSLSTPPPLDLSIKIKTTTAPITPPATPSPSSPIRKRAHTEPEPSLNVTPRTPSTKYDTCVKIAKTSVKTPSKKTKAVRKLNFDEDKSSPVSGTIIRELRDDEEPLIVRKGDIDPAFNVVEVTEEAKAELAKIENRIGDYICRLCKEMYEDAFTLAQHRCSRIVHVEYRCPECDKVFNCPANLASHRRWHKPRGPPASDVVPPVDLAPRHQLSDDGDSNSASEDAAASYPCPVCPEQFRRQPHLRKHLISHRPQLSEEHYEAYVRNHLNSHPPHSDESRTESLSPSYSTPMMISPPMSLLPMSGDCLTLPLHHRQVSAN